MKQLRWTLTQYFWGSYMRGSLGTGTGTIAHEHENSCLQAKERCLDQTCPSQQQEPLTFFSIILTAQSMAFVMAALQTS